DDLTVTAFAEQTRRFAHNALTKLVGRQTAVRRQRSVFRRDHERRIDDDEIKLSAAHRLEQIALQALHVCPPVELRVEAGEVHGTRVAIHTGDSVAMSSCQERLDATAGADVQS